MDLATSCLDLMKTVGVTGSWYFIWDPSGDQKVIHLAEILLNIQLMYQTPLHV